MQTEKQLTLAIETAVGGGSISVFEAQTLIDSWIGNAEISKAEDVLENISNLFERNSIKKKNIEKIIVSGDVGSTTGLKIGLATGKGLAKSFASRLIVASLIDSAIKVIANNKIQKYIIVLPVGRGNVFYQEFRNDQRASDGLVIKTADFFNTISENNNHIYAHQKIYDLNLTYLPRNSEFISIGENMASLLQHSKCV